MADPAPMNLSRDVTCECTRSTVTSAEPISAAIGRAVAANTSPQGA